MRTYRRSFAAVIALTIALPLFARHGNAAYETPKTVTVRGTITDFEFINPHVMVFFEAKNDKGGVEKWQGERRFPLGGPVRTRRSSARAFAPALLD